MRYLLGKKKTKGEEEKTRRGPSVRDCERRTAAEREEQMSPFCTKGTPNFATVELL